MMDELLTKLQQLLPLEEILRKSAKALVTIVIAYVSFFVICRAIRATLRTAGIRIGEEEQRQRVTTIILLLQNLAKYIIIFLAAYMVLADFGVDLTPVLAGAGVLGLAIGFGAQSLVKDVVSGFFIIMENQYAVGDLVEINRVFGRVEQVGLRITKIRDPNGELRHFANGSITTANNYTQDHVAYVVNVPLPPDQPADPTPFVQSVLADFEREFRVFVEKPLVEPADSLPTYSRLVRVKIKTIPGRHPLVEQKLPARMTAALERAGHPVPSGTEVTLSLLFP
ncbi:MAG: mechanosensitive ion channel family protein, partial [Proteobacteria bacterium]|nr:mechanosensitive ion channel family protein [Pseudomonadota bacterium]